MNMYILQGKRNGCFDCSSELTESHQLPYNNLQVVKMEWNAMSNM